MRMGKNVQKRRMTRGNEELFLSDGYVLNLIVVVVSQVYTYIIDMSKLMCGVHCIFITSQQSCLKNKQNPNMIGLVSTQNSVF